MTDHLDPAHPHGPESDTDLDPPLTALLADPAVWHDPPADGAERVVRAIGAESAPPVGTDRGPAARRSSRTLVAAALIGLTVVTAGAIVVTTLTRDGTEPGVPVALVAGGAGGGDPAGREPTAAVVATVERTATGVRIVLDARDLPRPDGDAYYHAWLSNDHQRMSAGTFLGGSERVELWCGVDDPSFTTLTITLESPTTVGDRGPEPVPAEPILVGRFGP